ncbi:MAG: hypothetical protein R3236_02240, partial [Phycisphaeraceae bacterium]|nr:hypothetical protein [Phycisphaeraceae bacterium]
MWMTEFAKASPEPELEEAGVEEEEASDEDVNELITTLLPWLVSVLLHVGLLLLAIFIVWSTVQVIDEEEVVVPISTLSKTPGAPVQMTQTKKQSQQSSSRSAAKSSLATASNAKSSSLATSATTSESSLIGLAGGGGGGG